MKLFSEYNYDDDLLYVKQQLYICTNYWDDFWFNESGRFKYVDQEDLVKHIVINLPNKKSFLKNDLKHLNNIFFDEINIKFVNILDNGQYKPDESNFENDKLDKVNIYVSSSIKNNIQKLNTTIMHEITHARQHYNRLKRNLNSLTELTNKTSRYAKTISNYNNFNKPGIELCKFILNRLDQLEQSAFISEIHIEYKDNEKIINDLSKTDAWQEYSTVKEYIENLSKMNQTCIKEFVDYWNKYHHTNLSFEKIYKLLHNKIDKILNKFVKLVEKICKEKTLEFNECKHISRNYMNLLFEKTKI